MRLKFAPWEIADIITNVRINGQAAGPEILNNIIPKSMRQGKINLADANNLVRDMEAFANHRTIKNSQGIISHILVCALVEREYRYDHKPDNLALFLKLIYQTHIAIDDFFKQHKKER